MKAGHLVEGLHIGSVRKSQPGNRDNSVWTIGPVVRKWILAITLKAGNKRDYRSSEIKDGLWHTISFS